MERITSEEQFEQYIQGEKPVVAVFSASWCPDCSFIEPFMPELVQQFADLRFVEVNRDDFAELCEKLGILGIPSFVAFKNGQEITRFVSKLRKSKEEITAYLDRTAQVAKMLS